jgi:hypothetical protein
MESTSTLTFGGNPNPKAIPQTIELLPVPFGPMTRFRCGPGLNSTLWYVRKLCSLIRRIEPGT